MSYAFTVRAATKAEAKEKVAAEFDRVVSTQPAHVRDRVAALAAADAFIDLLADDGTKDVSIGVNGSVGWYVALEPGQEAALPLTAASVSVSAHLALRT